MSANTTSRRRQFLKYASGVGSALVAGCSGQGDDDSTEAPGGGGGTGTVTDSGGSSGNQEVHFITEESAPESKEFFNEVTAQFTEETGIPVTVEYTGLGTSMGQRVSTLIQTGNAPEVVLVGGYDATNWVQQDIVADVSDLVGSIEDEWSEYQDRHRLAIDGADYLVPLHMNVAAQAYRTDLFDEAGVSPALTFEEERQMLPQLADSLPDGMSAANFAFNSGLNGQASVEMRTETNGVSWLGHSGDDPWSGFEITLDKGNNRERAIQSLEHIREIAEYSLNPNISVADWAPAYYTGKTAIGEFGGWRCLTGAYRESPDIAANSMGKRLAHGPNAEDPTYQTFMEGFTVLKASEYPDSGRKFVEFMMTGDRIFGMLLKLSPLHNVPALDAMFEDDRYRNAEFMEQNDVPDELLDLTKDEIKPRGLPRFNLAETPCPYVGSLQGTMALGKAANDVINGKDPGTAVDEAADTFRSKLQEVQG
jgi:ABC-type glycerol-3-phosphate transport system substrate-binding protein